MREDALFTDLLTVHMSDGKCTNCGQRSATYYCANCEQFRERLERLRAEQRERRSRNKPYRKQSKQVGGWFKDQCKRYGPALVAQRDADQSAPLAQEKSNL